MRSSFTNVASTKPPYLATARPPITLVELISQHRVGLPTPKAAVHRTFEQQRRVELVHAYSNPRAELQTLLHLLVKATSAPRPREQPTPRQSQIRLESHQANALAAAYSNGKTIRELARHFGIHRATVTTILEQNGVERRQVGLSEEQTAEACRLYPEGWSLARLADRYGVDDMTVRRYLLQSGVAMRSPHERGTREID